MRRGNILAAPLILGLLLGFTLVGCDDDDDDDDVNLADLDNLAVELANTTNAIALAVREASRIGINAQTQPAPVTTTVNCRPTGQLALQGTVTQTPPTFTTNLALTFNDCNDLQGSLVLANVTGSASLSQFAYDATANGELDNECRINFRQFRETVTVVGDVTTVTTGVLNGTLEAECGDNNFTCTFTNLPFSNEGVSREALAQNCEPS